MTDVPTTKRGYLGKQVRLAIWEREKGCCMLCGTKLQVGRFIFEHVRALELGGADDPSNIRLTCRACATEKTKRDHAMGSHAKRQKEHALGLKAPSKRPMPGGRNTPWKRKLNGTWERRD